MGGRGIVAHGAEHLVIENCIGIDLEIFLHADGARNITASRNAILGSNPYKYLVSRFPNLDGVDIALVEDAVIELKKASSLGTDASYGEQLLRETRLGRFLSRQNFVDWASLAVALSSLFL